MTAAGAGWGGDRVVYMLLAALVPLGLLGYWACGRDLFAPGMMLVLVTAFTTGCALYNMPLWQFELSGWTVWLLVSTLAVGVVLNGLVHACARRVRIIPWQGQSRPIPAGASWAVLAVLAVVAGIMLSQIRQIAGTGFFVEVMVRFRTRNSYGTDLADQLPLWVRQLLSLAAVLEVLYLFNLFKHGKRMGRLDRALNLGVVALATLVSLLTGGRFSAMTALVAAFVLWYMLGPDGPRALRPGRMVWAALVALGALYLFYGVRVFVGRQSEQGMLEYITHYAGGSLPGLDLYFKDPPPPSDIWGKETFYSLNQGLRKLGLLEIPYYLVHHEFRRSGGGSIGNVYTALRDYHYDFGLAGMYLLHIVFVLFFSIFYEYQKRRRSDLGLIVLAMMYYALAFYMISNFFYANLVSFGFAIRLGMTAALYLLLMGKRRGRPWTAG